MNNKNITPTIGQRWIYEYYNMIVEIVDTKIFKPDCLCGFVVRVIKSGSYHTYKDHQHLEYYTERFGTILQYLDGQDKPTNEQELDND
jgi:hypothetical protein